MTILLGASVVSALCALSTWLFVAPGLLQSGEFEPGPLFEWMVVLPTPIGLAAACVAVVAGPFALARRTDGAWIPALVTLLGQLATLALAGAILVWALKFPTTGWELLALPASLMLGQVVVAIGVGVELVHRRRSRRQDALSP